MKTRDRKTNVEHRLQRAAKLATLRRQLTKASAEVAAWWRMERSEHLRERGQK